MKKAVKTIRLSRETLRVLETSRLRHLGGAVDTETCYTNCNTCPADSCIRCQDSVPC